MKVRVKCTWYVDVEFPDGTERDLVEFMVGENSCPGTGAVGAALYRAIADGNARGVCWACNGHGENELVG